MTRRACNAVMATLLLTLASPVWSQQYLIYTPKMVPPGEKEQPKDGVLVREVPIKKGDTLFGLSRKFSGHGSYYSQILLFNDIKNPNLIYAGKTLKVPVSKEQPVEAAASAPVKAEKPEHADGSNTVAVSTVKGETAKPPTELSLSDLKPQKHGAHKKKTAGKKGQRHVAHSKKGVKAEQPAPVVTGSGEEPQRLETVARNGAESGAQAGVAAQRLYEQAVKAYKQDDCRAALPLLDRFLSENPESPLAADASLYKADCYLKLSGQ